MRNATYVNRKIHPIRQPAQRRHDQCRFDAATIKAAVSPIEFFRKEFPGWTPKRDHGLVMGPLCPFHDDRHPGSFFVNLDTGASVCYACGFGAGDVLDYVQVRDGVSFVEALRKLAADWGVSR